MVKSLKSTRTYTLAEIEDRLRGDGFNEEEAKKVVTALEVKPITIEEAARQYGIPEGTIRRWLVKGHLHEIGRIRYSAPGGGKVLVDAEEVRELADNRPKLGRPKKRR